MRVGSDQRLIWVKFSIKKSCCEVSLGVSCRTLFLSLPNVGVYPLNTTVAALQVSGEVEEIKPP